jgi:uncharacterized protein (TIGR01777 family)
MVTILITGGSGLIGKTLSDLLISKGYAVIILTRNKKTVETDTGITHKTYAYWNPGKSMIDREAIKKSDHIIHLAGAGIADKRWTKKRKKEIADSRIAGSNLIVKSLLEIPNKVQTVVSASGIGWYGPDRTEIDHAFIETDPAYPDFLGKTCELWEQSIHSITDAGKRLVILRTGIVLSNNGGALKEFRKPLRARVAAILGSGKQIISWVHIDDICRIYLYAIENKYMAGVYNATAPETVTNKEFVIKLSRADKRPFIPVHVPAFALKMVLGEMSIEVLKSTTVNDDRLRHSGFNFLFPSVDAAIGELRTEREREKREGRR